MDTIRVQVMFTKQEGNYPSYTDALYLSGRFIGMTEEEIQVDPEVIAMKTERYENFKHIIDNPPEAEPLAEE